MSAPGSIVTLEPEIGHFRFRGGCDTHDQAAHELDSPPSRFKSGGTPLGRGLVSPAGGGLLMWI